MSLGQDVLKRLPRALACEWLVGNGLGGSSSGTSAGAITRGSHAALAGLRDGIPFATLLKVDERALSDEGTFELACVVQPNGTARPAGHRLLESFSIEPWPTWRYRAGASVIEKSLMPVWEHDAVVISYRLIEGPPVRLTASPVLVSRPLLSPEMPAEAEQNGAGRRSARNAPEPAAGGAKPVAARTPRARARATAAEAPPAPEIQAIAGRVRVKLAAEAPLLTLWHNAAFVPGRAWTTLRQTAEDRAEEAYLPGYVEGSLTAEAPLHLVAATEPELFRTLAREARLGAVPPHTLAECVAALEADERERLASWAEAARSGALATAREAAESRQRPAPERLEPEAWTALLARGLDLGLVRRRGRLTVLESLPQSVERGASALRAVLGLIAVRSFSAARAILAGYLEYLNEGRAPERFEPDGAPVYGDPEPGLWLVIAGERYARRSGDQQFARATLYPALEEMMRHCRAGAPGGLKVDSDGLLMTLEAPDPLLVAEHAAEQERAAARPRRRRRPAPPPEPHTIKRSDLNALWYHAMVALSQLARSIGRRENAAFYLAWAREHQVQFHERMWDADHGCLYRALRDGEPVVGLDPSQLWAVSLSPALLAKERACALVELIDQLLVTPFGLRATPGGDAAWVEWLGPFLAADLKTHGRADEPSARARARLGALCGWLAEEGLGALPAAFEVTETDAAPPVRAPISPTAAAALLRLWIEEVEHAPIAAHSPSADPPIPAERDATS